VSFQLHSRLQQDCIALGQLPLSILLLMNDSRFPWCLLVPRRQDVSEIYQLPWDDQVQLARESDYLARALSRTYLPDKLNIAAIGNLVPQLHVHHVVRYKADSAWPAPVWGRGVAVPYSPAGLAATVQGLMQSLKAAGKRDLVLLPA